MSLLSKKFTLQTAAFSPTFRFHFTKSMSLQEKGPIQISIENKITEALNPTILEVANKSHLHAHHAAMKGNTNPETHFEVTVVSNEFEKKGLLQRHRIVQSLLTDEFTTKGLHALTLKTKTQAELENK